MKVNLNSYLFPINGRRTVNKFLTFLLFSSRIYFFYSRGNLSHDIWVRPYSGNHDWFSSTVLWKSKNNFDFSYSFRVFFFFFFFFFNFFICLVGKFSGSTSFLFQIFQFLCFLWCFFVLFPIPFLKYLNFEPNFKL